MLSSSSSNWKYPPFPLFSHFSVVVCLRCLLHHILSRIVYTFRESREFDFISIVQFMTSANSRILFGLQIAFVCLYITPLHYHNCANFIWRHWTYKMPVRYNLSSVWVRLSIFSQLSIIQYMGLCVFSLPISFVMIERVIIHCLIIIIKSEVWTITHCLGLGHETMVCAVCLSIFLCQFIGLVMRHKSSCNHVRRHAERPSCSFTFIITAYIFSLWEWVVLMLCLWQNMTKPFCTLAISLVSEDCH